MAKLKLYLLGPPRVELAGQAVDIRRRKALALLAYLGLVGEPQPRDTLATLLWPDSSQHQARASLSRDLSILGKRLGQGWFESNRETVGLQPGADLWLDATRFRRLLTGCGQPNHPGTQICADCLSYLREAAALYRADFLTGFTLRDSPNFDEWQSAQTESLRRELAFGLEQLSHAHRWQEAFEPAISYARRWLALDPLHEAAHRQLMRLYAESGQPAAALRQYQRCAKTLQAELGISPSTETTSLYDHIRGGNVSRTVQRQENEAASISEFRPAPAVRHNLPGQTTPFIGRETELAQLSQLLADPDQRLITIVGPGGMGKTRLALELASTQLDRFEHGVHLVRLAPLESPQAIVSTVAKVINFALYQSSPPQQQLLDYLRQKSMLLLLDNFEHLLAPPEEEIGGGVALVIAMLEAAPRLKLLVTSRIKLNLQGEQRFPLAGIDLPQQETLAHAGRSGAVQLFLRMAQRVQPDFQLAADNLAEVARICRAVEGMPLAIMLAAAWTELLSPAEIAAQLANEAGQGLDFLEAGWPDVPERQRRLRAVFDHSWKLLSEPEQTVFRQLSVFRGGFTREAAEAVTAASLQTLLALTNKSFLQPASEERYEIHELLRQYAAQKLDLLPEESETAHNRHSSYYCAFLQQQETALKGARQQIAVVEIGTEFANIWAAWHWAAVRRQVRQLARATESLILFCDWEGRSEEGETAFRWAAGTPDTTENGDELKSLAKVLAGQAHFSMDLGQAELSSRLISEGLSLLNRPELAGQDTRAERAHLLVEKGHHAIGFDRDETRRLFEQSLAIYREIGDHWRTARALGHLGWIARQSGNHDKARRLSEESVAIYRTLNDRHETIDSLESLAFGALQQGQLDDGERLMRESYAIRREIGKKGVIARGLRNLGVTLTLLGKFTEGYTLLEECITLYNELGNHSGLVFSTTWLGFAQMHLGQYKEARAQGLKGLNLAREIEHQGIIGNALWILGCVALVEKSYAEAQQLLQESVELYQALGQQNELSVTVATLGYAELGLGNKSQAWQYFSQSLRAVEAHAFYPLVAALPGIALLLADQGDKERSIELFSLASTYPYVANSRWFEDVAGRKIATVTATLPPEVVAASQKRGRAQDLWVTAEELLAEV